MRLFSIAVRERRSRGDICMPRNAGQSKWWMVAALVMLASMFGARADAAEFARRMGYGFSEGYNAPCDCGGGYRQATYPTPPNCGCGLAGYGADYGSCGCGSPCGDCCAPPACGFRAHCGLRSACCGLKSSCCGLKASCCGMRPLWAGSCCGPAPCCGSYGGCGCSGCGNSMSILGN